MRYFYPRPPRGGRRQAGEVHRYGRPISIHALREEGDGRWRRTEPGAGEISIHALREEGDHNGNDMPVPNLDISIHALREEGDTMTICSVTNTEEFLSTPSARRATFRIADRSNQRAISIHALREEGDQRELPMGMGHQYFYPRPPRGGRLSKCSHRRRDGTKFLSTPSARRATPEPAPEEHDKPFLSTPSARRATA